MVAVACGALWRMERRLLWSMYTVLSADYSDVYVRWKQQFDRWQNEYIVDWQFHFEQYKRYQSFRRSDSDGQCGS